MSVSRYQPVEEVDFDLRRRSCGRRRGEDGGVLVGEGRMVMAIVVAEARRPVRRREVVFILLGLLLFCWWWWRGVVWR